MSPNLKAMIMRHEGFREKPYTDSCGKLTISYGRNLTDVGISQNEAQMLLDNDIERARQAVVLSFSWFHQLDEVRQDVVISMVFNMGIKAFQEFKRMLIYLEMGDYRGAAEEMLESLWSNQVGPRAKELSAMMRTGQYQAVRS